MALLPNKDITRMRWIIDGDLNVCRVRAQYSTRTMKWSFMRKSKGKKEGWWGYGGLKPYYPTLCNGNGSYWGDGPQYKTKKEAKIEQIKIIKKEKADLKRTYRRKLEEGLEKLHQKVLQ